MSADAMPKCLRCGVGSDIERWAENGFVCPFCDRWFCGPLRRNYLAEHAPPQALVKVSVPGAAG